MAIGFKAQNTVVKRELIFYILYIDNTVDVKLFDGADGALLKH